MGLWEDLPVDYRLNGEQVLWEGAAAVLRSAVIDGEVVPIDTAGVDLGFLIATTRQVLAGHRKKRLLRQRLDVWERINKRDLDSIGDHRDGVAFFRPLGPANLITAGPARDIEGLRSALRQFWGRPYDERREGSSKDDREQVFHVSWSGNGASYYVVDEGSGPSIQQFEYDHDPAADATATSQAGTGNSARPRSNAKAANPASIVHVSNRSLWAY